MGSKHKISLLLSIMAFLLTGAIIISLSVGVTYGRYSTQKAHNLSYLAGKVPSVYNGGQEILKQTLFQSDGWTMTEQGQTCSLALSNVSADSTQPPAEDCRFQIRAFIPDVTGDDDTVSRQTLEFTVSVGEKTYKSKAYSVSNDTMFYSKHQKNGWYYCFYESLDGTTAKNEAEYCLEGGKASTLPITVTVESSVIDYSKIWFYVVYVK
ncbi:MAG: hypothetical protein IJY33_03080 [Oscillospiraceae bacterium]|nr:hypothetical protein [Oscillospiraceae bacterium]